MAYILECYVSNGNGQMTLDVDKSNLSDMYDNRYSTKTSCLLNNIVSGKGRFAWPDLKELEYWRRTAAKEADFHHI